jgi:hypothetical protein
MTDRRVGAGRPRDGLYLGRVRLTPMRLAIALAFLGSLAYIAWAVLRVRDTTQLPMVSTGFLVLGVAFTAVAIGSLVGMWRAASRACGGRAMALAVSGGLAGLAAIGCFTVTVLLALVWRS